MNDYNPYLDYHKLYKMNTNLNPYSYICTKNIYDREMSYIQTNDVCISRGQNFYLYRPYSNEIFQIDLNGNIKGQKFNIGLGYNKHALRVDATDYRESLLFFRINVFNPDIGYENPNILDATVLNVSDFDNIKVTELIKKELGYPIVSFIEGRIDSVILYDKVQMNGYPSFQIPDHRLGTLDNYIFLSKDKEHLYYVRENKVKVYDFYGRIVWNFEVLPNYKIDYIDEDYFIVYIPNDDKKSNKLYDGLLYKYVKEEGFKWVNNFNIRDLDVAKPKVRNNILFYMEPVFGWVFQDLITMKMKSLDIGYIEKIVINSNGSRIWIPNYRKILYPCTYQDL